MRKIILLALFTISTSFTSFAQDLDKYTWNTHGITIQAPTGLEITLSNKDYFELDNEYYTIKMDYYNHSIELVNDAVENGLNINTSVTDSWTGNDYIGTSIQGRMKDSENYMIAAKIQDRKNKKNYYVEIIYGDGNYANVRKVLRSITTQ